MREDHLVTIENVVYLLRKLDTIWIVWKGDTGHTGDDGYCWVTKDGRIIRDAITLNIPDAEVENFMKNPVPYMVVARV